MDDKLNKDTRKELVRVLSLRYSDGSRDDKRKILDEFVAVTGYHRKHAIRVLTSGALPPAARPPRRRLYDEAIQRALIVLWEASDRVCGKRLKPLLPALIDSLERHGHLQLDASVRERLLSASAATIDRLLAEPRSKASGRTTKRPAKPAIRRSVPVRTFDGWKEPLPGCMEADLVAHCGASMAGSFVHTLVLTDIASGWTECLPLPVRYATLVVEAIDRLRPTLPFPLRAFDSDNGSEFVNEAVVAYCLLNGIEVTRSRPYRKNDQAWVEQKNGSVVRRLVGYGRLEGLPAAEALGRLYAASRLFVNFFQPSFKLLDKTRNGSRVIKRYDTPATPCARLLASSAITEATKERLRDAQMAIDPLRLLEEIRTLQAYVAEFAEGRTSRIPPAANADLTAFLAGLSSAWKGGEVRPTHQPKSRRKRTRNWRTRKDPFEHVWPQILDWLEKEPDRTAKELLERLQGSEEGRFPDNQLRTLQRRVKEWRSTAANNLVFGNFAPE